VALLCSSQVNSLQLDAGRIWLRGNSSEIREHDANT